MNLCPRLEGGSIGPITSVPHAANGHAGTVGCKGLGGRWGISPWIWHWWHFLAYSTQSLAILDQKYPMTLNLWYIFGPDWCAPHTPECTSSIAFCASSSDKHLRHMWSYDLLYRISLWNRYISVICLRSSIFFAGLSGTILKVLNESSLDVQLMNGLLAQIGRHPSGTMSSIDGNKNLCSTRMFASPSKGRVRAAASFAAGISLGISSSWDMVDFDKCKLFHEIQNHGMVGYEFWLPNWIDPFYLSDDSESPYAYK